ncbi:MAG: GNAT family N-acetyltransferase [Anaerolineae bacterium]|nr:GNAT family N-acetyltransferase [Anaerolineae bacterium]
MELTPNEFYTVAPLFAGIGHNVALVYAVIEGNSPGRIFIDRPGDPLSALVLTDAGYSYVGGHPDNDEFNRALAPLLFNEILPQMEEKELILFAFSEAWRDKLDILLRPHGAIVIQRKVFDFNPGRFAVHAGWRARVPAGFQMRRIDTSLAEKRPDFSPLVEAQSKRFGVCLMQDDAIVSACTAVGVGGGEAEVDIYTEEAYQGRGYGFLTACAFIEECLARGLTPSWACWPYRVASQALAHKLGFEARPDAPAHFWAENM